MRDPGAALAFRPPADADLPDLAERPERSRTTDMMAIAYSTARQPGLGFTIGDTAQQPVSLTGWGATLLAGAGLWALFFALL